MPGVLVRIAERTDAVAKELAKSEDTTKQKVIEEAVEALWWRRKLAAADKAYDEWRGDAQAWQAEIRDRKAWAKASLKVAR